MMWPIKSELYDGVKFDWKVKIKFHIVLFNFSSNGFHLHQQENSTEVWCDRGVAGHGSILDKKKTLQIKNCVNVRLLSRYGRMVYGKF